MVITHLLLDIEGTTCPVSFVAEVLFPYARQRLGCYLHEHAHEPEVAALVEAVWELWRSETTPEARALFASAADQGAANGQQANVRAVVPYLEWLIDHDVKATPLKDLQGRIWRAGYAAGALQAPLFADVPESLRRWAQRGLTLAVYSSGSVAAQQLLYGHSQGGDLRGVFSHWFDTRIGAKQDAASYGAIARSMGCEPGQVLFISDSGAELQAASEAGMAVLFSDRPGNPHRDSGSFERISDYSQLRFNDDADRP